MKVLVNGLGCSYGGNRIVLDRLLLNLPDNLDVTVILAQTKDVNIISSKKAKIINLNHKIFGILIRPIFDLLVNFYFKASKFDAYLNLSNYGLCFTKNQTLYLHDLHVLDAQEKSGLKHFYKRKAFNTYLFKTSKIFFQTEHIKSKFQEYIKSNNLDERDISAKISVIKPYHEIDKIKKNGVPRNFFKLFYPASDFEHKNKNLAITAAHMAGKIDKVKLQITVDPPDDFNNSRKVIRFLGKIPYRDVVTVFNNSDALLFTSSRESLGLPLLEALSIGLPAVLPNLPYAKEIYGDAAVYFDEFNQEAVKTSILELKSKHNIYKDRAEKRWEQEKNKRISWGDHWNHFLK